MPQVRPCAPSGPQQWRRDNSRPSGPSPVASRPRCGLCAAARAASGAASGFRTHGVHGERPGCAAAVPRGARGGLGACDTASCVSDAAAAAVAAHRCSAAMQIFIKTLTGKVCALGGLAVRPKRSKLPPRPSPQTITLEVEPTERIEDVKRLIRIKGALEAWRASALVQAPCCEELHPHPRCLAAQRGSLLTSSASSSRGSS